MINKKRYIGDRAFYRTLLAIAVPIMLQNGLTNLVSLLDNIMVGAIGTEQMSGVSIVNQLIFVFNLCVFGGVSGAGIFTAQFYGKGDHRGVMHTFRFKFLLCLALAALWIGILLVFGEQLIAQYLHDGSETGDLAATALYGAKYLRVMLWGMIPFAVQQSYASTLRETGETLLPMKAGIVAILVNLVLNYILIFGNFGAPAMGVEGAAVATVISRYVECTIVMTWTHRHTDRSPFIVGAYRSLRVPGKLVGDIVRRGTALLVNEFLWSAGVAILNQSYSTRGLAVVAALNISSTVVNLFSVVWIALGSAVSIIVGRQLGAGEFDEAENSCWRILTFSVASAVGVGVLMIGLSGVFTLMYNTTEEVRGIAAGLIQLAALSGILHAFNHASYFTLRSGGKTWITFLFDSAFMWVVTIPAARILSLDTPWHILVVYGLVQSIDLIKCVFGWILLRKRVWIHRIV